MVVYCVGGYFTDLMLPCYLWQINQSGLVNIHRIVSDICIQVHVYLHSSHILLSYSIVTEQLRATFGCI
jgi:hypothetical protein